MKLEESWDESCVCIPCFLACVFATTCLSCLTSFASQIAFLNLVALNAVPRSANLVATFPQGCLSLSLLSLLQRRLGCWVGVWQDADVQKAALLVKSYLSITRGWTKVFVRECKLGRSIPKDTHQCHHHDVGVGGFASYFMFANDFHIFVGSGTYCFVLNLP